MAHEILIVDDEEDAALPLPRGSYDVPLMIQDRTFDDDNQLVYLSQQSGGMMGGRGMMGNRGMMYSLGHIPVSCCGAARGGA